MFRVYSFETGQLIVDAQAQTYTCAHLLPHLVRFSSPDQKCRYQLDLQFVDLRYFKQHNRRKDGLYFNKTNCFSMELEAEIINTVDMKRKTKAQTYRDYKCNIKMFVWNTLYLLEGQRSHQTQSIDPWVQVILLTNRGSN